MDDSCGKWYEANTGLLFIVFKIQVILLGIASIFGVITCVSQASVLIAEIAGRKVSPSVLRALPKSALASACLAFSCARRPELVSAFACAAPATCLDSL